MKEDKGQYTEFVEYTTMNNLEKQKDKIIEFYRNYKSIRDIASILGCSFSGIKRILKKYDEPRRNKCESLNLCPMDFEKIEFDVVLGNILGDGHITKHKKRGESQLSIGHSIKQKEYVTWKHQILNRWIGCKMYELEHILNNGKKYITINFVTRKNKNFTNLRNIFYKNNNKNLTINFIAERINEISLAVWYMDDGYNYPNGGCEFCSESFSKQENIGLVNILKEKFGIISHIRQVRKDQYRIYICKEDKVKFFSIIEKYIILSMQYKIEM